jgi:hypothetical protein
MSSRIICPPNQRSTRSQQTGMNFQLVTLPAPHSMADLLTTLYKPFRSLLFLGSDTGASPAISLSFSPTGQAGIVNDGSNAFNPTDAFKTPIITFTSVISFRFGIQTFYSSFINNNNPGSIWLLAIDDLMTLDTINIQQDLTQP